MHRSLRVSRLGTPGSPAARVILVSESSVPGGARSMGAAIPAGDGGRDPEVSLVFFLVSSPLQTSPNQFLIPTRFVLRGLLSVLRGL